MAWSNKRGRFVERRSRPRVPSRALGPGYANADALRSELKAQLAREPERKADAESKKPWWIDEGAAK